MTEHYSHISTAAKQEAINALPFLKEIPMSTETPRPADVADAAEDDGVIGCGKLQRGTPGTQKPEVSLIPFFCNKNNNQFLFLSYA